MYAPSVNVNTVGVTMKTLLRSGLLMNVEIPIFACFALSDECCYCGCRLNAKTDGTTFYACSECVNPVTRGAMMKIDTNGL